MKKIKTVKEYLYDFFIIHKDKLIENYPGIKEDIFLQKYLLYKNLNCHLQAKDCFLNPNDYFFTKVLEGIPFEYLLSEKFFFNHNFIVNSDVLIPRNETEILVEDVVNYISKNHYDNFKMLEVGVGSGCIFLSILCELSGSIDCTATDISFKALEVAKTNYFRLEKLIHKNTNVNFQCIDRLEGLDQKFDLIVSNPPYIKKNEGQSGVHWQVNQYEPHLALYLDDNIHDEWFLTFFKQVNSSLKTDGVFMMEGHENTLELLANLAKPMFSSGSLKKDYTGRTRFLYLKK